MPGWSSPKLASALGALAQGAGAAGVVVGGGVVLAGGQAFERDAERVQQGEGVGAGVEGVDGAGFFRPVARGVAGAQSGGEAALAGFGGGDKAGADLEQGDVLVAAGGIALGGEG
jgi:hypothetical protein